MIWAVYILARRLESRAPDDYNVWDAFDIKFDLETIDALAVLRHAVATVEIMEEAQLPMLILSSTSTWCSS